MANNVVSAPAQNRSDPELAHSGGPRLLASERLRPSSARPRIDVVMKFDEAAEVRYQRFVWDVDSYH
jgi:hypothetical protein